MSPRVVSTVALILLLACSLVYTGNMRHPTRIKPCCTRVTTINITGDVIGDTYQMQLANKPCVKAVVLKTVNGSVCTDPQKRWVKHLIRNMKEE